MPNDRIEPKLHIRSVRSNVRLREAATWEALLQNNFYANLALAVCIYLVSLPLPFWLSDFIDIKVTFCITITAVVWITLRLKRLNDYGRTTKNGHSQQ